MPQIVFKDQTLPEGAVALKGYPQLNQVMVNFTNGYQASIVSHEFSYGGGDGLFEIAVMHNNQIVYDTPVTNDVLGHLDEEDVLRHLNEIHALPAR
tara:strand:- start:551 stop:838 length:288 start_codon:yes stop_codon:yes gene_type:complete